MSSLLIHIFVVSLVSFSHPNLTNRACVHLPLPNRMQVRQGDRVLLVSILTKFTSLVNRYVHYNGEFFLKIDESKQPPHHHFRNVTVFSCITNRVDLICLFLILIFGGNVTTESYLIIGWLKILYKLFLNVQHDQTTRQYSNLTAG